MEGHMAILCSREAILKFQIKHYARMCFRISVAEVKEVL
jgi:hypothetical protein